MAAPAPVPPTPQKRRPKRFLVYAVLAVAAAGAVCAVAAFVGRPVPAPPGMVRVPAGTFDMGSDIRRNEGPVHRVTLAAFYMDEHEVTNAQFRKFVEATKHVTVAERPPSEETRQRLKALNAPPEMLEPGAMVFSPPAGPVDLNDVRQWWKYTPGASWKHPEGPSSDLRGRDHHPVVQVGFDDARAYARWAGKTLPTEAQWEYAARGGLAGKRFAWGDDPPDARRANIWQGDFPWRNTKADGYDRTAPAKSYPPNGYGLYDMAGNVWEWCDDWYAPRYPAAPQVNPTGPADRDPRGEPLRVTRGGSYLCHETYCESYRPAARQGSAPDDPMGHTGFRCVMPAE